MRKVVYILYKNQVLMPEVVAAKPVSMDIN